MNLSLLVADERHGSGLSVVSRLDAVEGAPDTTFSLVVISGPRRGQRFSLLRRRTLLGRGAECHIRLVDRAIARRHCEIEVGEGEVVLRQVSRSAHTFVNGVAVREVLLHHGATIAVGRALLRVDMARRPRRLPGVSRAAVLLRREVSHAAPANSGVLIYGEPGVGKEQVARAVHHESFRRAGPFVRFSCAISSAGRNPQHAPAHVGTSGTDALRAALCERAAGGTLFLSEVDQLTPSMQSFLAHLLAREQRLHDARLIASTSGDLTGMVHRRAFRRDLYLRIAVGKIRVPPLRERLDDLEVLVERALDQLPFVPIAATLVRSTEFRSGLRDYAWPGNLTELRDYVELCTVVGRALPLPPPAALDNSTGDADGAALTIDVEKPLRDVRKDWVLECERRYLEALLRRHRGNVAAAARAASMNRGHLHRLIARCGLSATPTR